MDILTIPVVSDPEGLEGPEIVHTVCLKQWNEGVAFCGTQCDDTPIQQQDQLCTLCEAMEDEGYCPLGSSEDCGCRARS